MLLLALLGTLCQQEPGQAGDSGAGELAPRLRPPHPKGWGAALAGRRRPSRNALSPSCSC